MNLNRIEAKCMVDNIGSEKVMKNNGMKFEGIMKQGIYAKVKFYDLKMYALLKNDWLSGKSK